MKKYIAILACSVLAITIIGCSDSSEKTDKKTVESEVVSSDNTEEGNKTEDDTIGSNESEYDVDLTALSSIMAYSEAANMIAKPDEYKGKMVKISGNFGVYHDDATGKDYFACMIYDSTACCSQNIEFVLGGEHVYPDDYPQQGSEIIVSGKFDTYTEGSMSYCYLTNAVLEGME